MEDVRVTDNSDEVLRELDSAVSRALEDIGLTAERHAKEICPVDTGRLRNSISHAVDEKESVAIIGTNVEYAPSIELGHSKQAPNGFLGPAVRDHIQEYKNILKDHMQS